MYSIPSPYLKSIVFHPYTYILHECKEKQALYLDALHDLNTAITLTEDGPGFYLYLSEVMERVEKGDNNNKKKKTLLLGDKGICGGIKSNDDNNNNNKSNNNNNNNNSKNNNIVMMTTKGGTLDYFTLIYNRHILYAKGIYLSI